MAHGRPNKATDGTITYPYRGWEPPPVMDGYRRKTNDLKSPDAWTFLPIIPPCEHRTSVTETGSCGAQSVKYSCKDMRLYDLSRCWGCNEKD